MADVTVVDGAFGPLELVALDRLRLGCDAYLATGVPAPRRLRPPPPVPDGRLTRLRFAPGIGGRYDTTRYHARLAAHHRRAGAPLPAGSTQYLRATYARRGTSLRGAPAAEVLRSDGLTDLATACHDATVAVPFLLYANVYLPGQVLDAHTDVPAFRGADLANVAPWLLVVMHHSGCFERWRIPIATVVGYLDGGGGGDLTHVGPDGRPVRVVPAANTAVVFDADTVFHQVGQVAGTTAALARLSESAFLRPGRRRWTLAVDNDGRDEPIATFLPGELRWSVSWKAFCFADDASRRSWESHTDDLDVTTIVPTLVGELCRRGVLDGPDHGLDERELAAVLIDGLVPFPLPGWADVATAGAVPAVPSAGRFEG